MIYFAFWSEFFLHSISKRISFVTIERMLDKRKPNLLRCKQNVIVLYARRGLNVVLVNADNQFRCIKNDLPCKMENVAKGEHLGDIERSIRTQEEHTRILLHRVSFRSFPRVMADSAAIFPSFVWQLLWFSGQALVF